MRLSGKGLLLGALAGLLLCGGCTRYYVVRLTNGSQFGAIGKPKLREGTYFYTDGKGRDRTIPAGRVSEIMPASMAQEEEERGQMKASSSKKKHWYWPF